MQNKDRKTFVIIGVTLLVVSGYAGFGWVFQHCGEVSVRCSTLVFILLGTIAGTILLIESLHYMKEKSSNYAQQTVTSREQKTSVWIKSVLRIILSSVLLSTPLLVRGVINILFWGCLCGLAIDGLVRFYFGRLPLMKTPSVQDDIDSID
ncbi:MAG: hypothetical protein H6662_18975 [Ardenticatenaceae bacterium]|nr:hypothetical protein [Ardenticatenaceae bacterium]